MYWLFSLVWSESQFKKKCFNNDLRTELSIKSIKSYGSFENIFLNTLNKNAPIKKKMVRANHAPYVTKALRKTIMKRSYLENVYFKKRTPESMKKYKKQKTSVVNYIRRSEGSILKVLIHQR